MDGLTALERIFLGWAQVWQSKGRDEEVLRRLATDPHSPNEFRCNGVVRNVDEFYTTYGVAPGDALYLPGVPRPHLVTPRTLAEVEPGRSRTAAK
nr:hypothetical protein GCM10025730_16950 [Promicromonospora thailandica]